ncbi:MAG TPA: DNA polymerase IV [Chitinophagaceae bacterium]|nr:DNA polymerase IV [Chitinophagaceae bacterium]
MAHLDMDTFYVSVECLKNSGLKGKPLIVGGGDRGVVTSCSYETRKFQVRSGMSMKMAKRLCPEAIIIKGDFEDYIKYSKLITDVISDTVPVFEKASIDEFYIDLTGMERYFGACTFISEVKKKVLKETGLPVSYGLASNKLVSKVATNEAKPNGQLAIPFGQEKNFLAPLSVAKIPGIGKETAMLLVRRGVETVRFLAEIPVEMLQALLGKDGIELSRRANGIDDTPVIPYHEQKSISTERTFENDTTDISFLYSALARMTEAVAFHLREQNKLAGCIGVKIKYSNFDTESKQRAVQYTNMDEAILRVTRELFNKLYNRRLLIRLVGIRLSDLIPGTYQIDLYQDTQEKINLYQSIDSIKKRFGEQLLMRAVGLKHTNNDV